MTAWSKFLLVLVFVNLFFAGMNFYNAIARPSEFYAILAFINLGAAIFILFLRAKLK
jgi:hypothetical protein